MQKSTGQLQEELMTAPDIARFIRENSHEMHPKTFMEHLNGLVDASGMTKSVLAKASGMSEVYLYQILSGRRNPTRERILCICFGLQLTVDQSQSLLRSGACAALYPRSKRDAVLIYALTEKMTLFDVNDLLFSLEEKTLC